MVPVCYSILLATSQTGAVEEHSLIHTFLWSTTQKCLSVSDRMWSESFNKGGKMSNYKTSHL